MYSDKRFRKFIFEDIFHEIFCLNFFIFVNHRNLFFAAVHVKDFWPKVAFSLWFGFEMRRVANEESSCKNWASWLLAQEFPKTKIMFRPVEWSCVNTECLWHHLLNFLYLYYRKFWGLNSSASASKHLKPLDVLLQNREVRKSHFWLKWFVFRARKCFPFFR